MGHVAHLAQALFLERGVADGQHLVDDQNLRLQMRRHGKRQPHVHAAGIALDLRIEEFFDFREGHDLVEPPGDIAPAHAENGAVEIDVFAPGEIGMEARADLQQAADAADQFDAPFGGLGDLREDFEQRAFAGAVAADDADHFSLLDIER